MRNCRCSCGRTCSGSVGYRPRCAGLRTKRAWSTTAPCRPFRTCRENPPAPAEHARITRQLPIGLSNSGATTEQHPNGPAPCSATCAQLQKGPLESSPTSKRLPNVPAPCATNCTQLPKGHREIGTTTTQLPKPSDTRSATCAQLLKAPAECWPPWEQLRNAIAPAGAECAQLPNGLGPSATTIALSHRPFTNMPRDRRACSTHVTTPSSPSGRWRLNGAPGRRTARPP